jgi:cation transport ATPase
LRNSFAIENIDCPMCALKIEEALNQLPGVSHAAVDFTNQRLHLDADDLERCADHCPPRTGCDPHRSGRPAGAGKPQDTAFRSGGS